MRKRLFSILLALCMVLCLVPTTAFAESETEETPVCTCETACTAEVNITPLEGASLVTYAMQQRFGPWAGKLLSIAILLFAFTTVLGWSFYGTKATEYLFGTKSTIVYRIIFIVFIVFGATMDLSLAWDIADTLNALMAIPNLIGLLGLSGVVVKLTNDHFKDRSKALKR